MKLAPRTLFGRIALGAVVAMLAASWIVGAAALARHDEAAQRRERERLRMAVQLLEPQALLLLEGDEESPLRARDDLARAARAAGLRVAVLDERGRVLFDSEGTLLGADLSDRPEIREALRLGEGVDVRAPAPGRTRHRFLARRIGSETEAPAGFVRVAAPAVPSDLRAELVELFLVGAAGSVLLGLVAAAWLSRWLGDALALLTEKAERLAALEFEGKVRPGGTVEIRRLGRALNHAASRLARHTREMQRARRELDAIHASMREGVVAVDHRERVILMNRAAAALLGLPEPLRAGEELWRAVRFPELEQALRRVLAGEREWHGETASPSDPRKVLSISVTRVEPDIGAVALLSDVTLVRRVDKVRIDFVANVSHEVRTPLSAILGALETLQSPGISDEERKRFVDIARRNAERLQAIVEDLLDLSAIESEGERMPMEPVAIDEVVRRAVSSLSGQAEAKGLRLETVADEGGDWSVVGNAKRLEQVFVNLIQNAIKYTPEGGRIQVRLRSLPDRVEIDVEDTGVGIPAASLPRIFERFYRVDRHRSREMGGTGLGLSIVKHSVAAHGGKVAVRSEEGRGTTFTVKLPRRPPSD